MRVVVLESGSVSSKVRAPTEVGVCYFKLSITTNRYRRRAIICKLN